MPNALGFVNPNELDLIDLSDSEDFPARPASSGLFGGVVPASATPDPDMELPSSLECVVCMRTMVEPKSLHCGHSLCASCTDRITVLMDAEFFGSVPRISIKCPICQSVREVPLTGLPTNYALRDAIEQLKDEACSIMRCAACKKTTHELHICVKCTHWKQPERICPSCVLASHRNHPTKLAAKAWTDKEIEAVVRDANTIQTQLNGYGEKAKNFVRLSTNLLLSRLHGDQVTEMSAFSTSEAFRAMVAKGCLKAEVEAKLDAALKASEATKKRIDSFMDDFCELVEKHKNSG